VPDGFKFAIKGSRFCSNRKMLGEGGEAVERFCGQGFTELGDRLGPILWQFMATKKFDPEDFRRFPALLPRSQAGVPLRHAVELGTKASAIPPSLRWRGRRAWRSCSAIATIIPASPTQRRLSSTRGSSRPREEEPPAMTPLRSTLGGVRKAGRGESPPAFQRGPARGATARTYVFMIYAAPSSARPRRRWR
jgi:hypothetical protein